MISLTGIYLVGGQRVELPDSVAAQMGFQRAPDITQTPFAPTPVGSGGGDGALVRHETTNIFGGSACKALASRAQLYPGIDPVPNVRAVLVSKCEAERAAAARAGHGTRAVETETKKPTDPKLIVAGVVAVAVVGLLVAKKLKKR